MIKKAFTYGKLGEQSPIPPHQQIFNIFTESRQDEIARGQRLKQQEAEGSNNEATI